MAGLGALILFHLAGCVPSAPTAPSIDENVTTPVAIDATDSTDGTTALPNSVEVSTVTPPPPFSVSPQWNEKRAVTGLISEKGGSVSLTLANGAKVTLSLPQGAMLNEGKIGLVPAEKIENFPLGKVPEVMVKLEPEGLRLLLPATLSFELTDQATPSDVFGFMANPKSEFSLYPVSAQGNALSLQILRFNEFGFGSGTPQEISEIRKHIPGDPYARATQAWEAPDADRNRILDELWQDGVLPHLQSAGEDGEIWAQSLMDMKEWEALMKTSALGKDLPQLDEGFPQLANLFSSAFDFSAEQCISSPDFFAPIEVLRLAALATRLGPETQNANFSLTPQQEDKLKACADFELVFESLIEGGLEDQWGQWLQHIRSTVPLRIDGDIFKGEGPLRYLGFSLPERAEQGDVSAHRCVNVFRSNDSVFTVTRLSFGLNPKITGTSGSFEPEIIFAANPGHTTESQTGHCLGGGGSPFGEQARDDGTASEQFRAHHFCDQNISKTEIYIWDWKTTPDGILRNDSQSRESDVSLFHKLYSYLIQWKDHFELRRARSPAPASPFFKRTIYPSADLDPSAPFFHVPELPFTLPTTTSCGDVPLPEGITNYYVVGPGASVVSSLSVDDLITFYKKTMPDYGWDLVKEDPAHTPQLTFDKSFRTTTVILTPQAGGTVVTLLEYGK